MSDNPYQSPTQPSNASASAIGVLSGSREDLRSVAKYQKGILVCILIYLMAIVGQFVIPEGLRPLLGVGVLCTGLVATVFVFLLATKVYSTGVGLLVLLTVNGKATGILQQNGIKVGLLGTNLSKV